MNTKLFFVVNIFLISCFTGVLKAENSNWKSHTSYEKDVTGLERIGNTVYALTGGKLFTYDLSSQQVAGEVLKPTQNDSIISIIAHPQTNQLLLVRYSFEVDVFDGTTFKSIPYLRKLQQVIDKKINDISVDTQYAYIATNSGILIVDIAKAEVYSYCQFLFPVYSVVKNAGYFYMSTSKGIYRTQENKELSNLNNWELFSLSAKNSSGASFSDTEIRTLTSLNDILYFLVPSKSLFSFDGTSVVQNSTITDVLKLEQKGQDIFAYNASRFWVMNADGIKPFVVANSKSAVADVIANEYWVGLANKFLSKLRKTTTSHTVVLQNIRPSGPISNYPFDMVYQSGKLVMVGGGYLYNFFSRPAQLSELDASGWYNYPRATTAARDFTSVGVNPADPTNLLVATWGLGIYEFKDRAYLMLHNKTNSSLQDIFTGSSYTRIDGIRFEGPDKFWACNSMVSTVANLFQKENGVWKSYGFDYPEIYTSDTHPLATNVADILVDKQGNKWIVCSPHPYIFIFNENGTPADLSDDKRRLMREFYDQNGVRLIIAGIKKLELDVEGNVWIGSENGLFKVTPPENVYEDDIVLERLELTDNSSSPVLNKALVLDIAFDKLNRKWVATEENGVYLLDAEGKSVLAHFTTDNSPLPSDKVLSVAVDEKCHAYIGTANGILEYSGFENLDPNPNVSKEVYASRNLIDKGFKGGEVKFYNLEPRTNFKIVNKANKVIYSGNVPANGIVEWSGKTFDQSAIEPEVYYLVGTDLQQKKGTLLELKITN